MAEGNLPLGVARWSRPRTGGRRRSPILVISTALILALLAGCGGPSAQELAAVDYAPLPGGDWPVSTPEKQGLDPALVARMYHDAGQLETLYTGCWLSRTATW